MGFCAKLLPLLLLAAPAFAGTPYSITGLRPMGISQYAVPERGAQREYLHFANELGSHRFVYEELPSKPAMIGVAGMRGVMGNSDMVCMADLDCREQALCTGRCQNMYYEMSNTPEDPALAGRNQCTVLSFKCKKAGT